MTHKQESGRTVLETIAVLTIAAVLLITSIGGIAFLIQRNNRKQSTKEVASMVTAIFTSNVLRKYDTGEQIPVREVVQGPKVSLNEVMILSEGKDSFMIVTAWGNNEFVADLQVQPGTCSDILEALGQDEISVAVFEETDRVDTASEFLNPISLTKDSVQFQKLNSDQIAACNATGIFAFKMGNPAYLYDESLHLCPRSQIEDIYGACCAPSKACGNVCSCPSGQHCKDKKVCVDCLSDSDCKVKHICKDNKCQAVDCTQNSDCPSITPICNSEYECESCPDNQPAWNNGQCVECANNDDCSGGKVCNSENTCACPTDKHWNDSTSSCVECANNDDCSGGKVCSAENTCVCPTDKHWNESTSSCVECANNNDCSGGKVCNSANTCVCPEGEHWNESTSSCVECANNNDCSGGKVCNSANTCVCPEGEHWNGTECVACTEATPYWNGTECVECIGNTQCPSHKTCVENSCVCDIGYVKTLRQDNPCVKCEGGYMCTNGERVSCPRGVSYDGICCTNPFVIPKQLKGKGTISVKEETISGVKVNVNYYNPSEAENNIAPLNCHAGEYPTWYGYMFQCTPCPKGYFSVEGANACTPAPKGTYVSGTKSSTFEKCPAGTFNTEFGGVGCVDCVPGKISGEMATSCTNCPAGTYANGTKTINGMSGFGSTSCEECPNGTYSVEGSSKCVPCNGELQYTNRKKSACYTCPLGQKANTTHTGCVNQN